MRQSGLMVRAAAMLFLLFLPTLTVVGQRAKVPTFGQYPARVEKARARAIDFSHSPGAGTFRTRLRQALAGGVNFAGHYIVAGWGCGTGCISGAIIDARDGRVYFPEAFHDIAVWYDDSGYTDEPVKFRKNSCLFVISGISGEQNEWSGNENAWGDHYYEWRNNNLRLIRFVRKKRTNGR